MTERLTNLHLLPETWPEKYQRIVVDIPVGVESGTDGLIGWVNDEGLWRDCGEASSTEYIESLLASLPVPMEAWAGRGWDEAWVAVFLTDKKQRWYFGGTGYPSRRAAFIAAADAAILWAVQEWKRRNP